MDCHFIFEVQLLCLSLHIEVLSFEDSEWSRGPYKIRGRYKMEFQVEKLEHFRHILLLLGIIHSFLFLTVAYTHHFSSPVTIQYRNGRCFSRANRWRGSWDAHMATRWFLWFWLRACSTHAPDFWTFPIECKCRMMVELPQFITFASTRLQWRGLLWINMCKRSSSNPECLPERGVSLLSKRSSLKREKHFLAALSPTALSPYTVQMFLAASATFALQFNSKRRTRRKCSNFSTWHFIF